MEPSSAALTLTLQHAVTGENLVTWDDLEESTTASQLRQRAASALGLRDVTALRLLLCTVELQNHGTLKSAGVKDGDVLQVLFTEGLGFVTWTKSRAQLWRLSGGEPAASVALPREDGDVLSMALDRISATLAARTERTVKVWDVGRGEVVFDHSNGESGSKALAICQGGQLVAFWGDADGEPGQLQVWNIHEKCCVCICRDCAALVCFSPDGQRVVAGGLFDAPASVWDISAGKQLWTLGHGTDGFFSGLLFSPDGSSVVIASREPNWEEIDLWCGKTGSWLRGLGGGAFGLAFSEDGEELAGLDEVCSTVYITSTLTGSVLVQLSLAEWAGSRCSQAVLKPSSGDFCFAGVWEEDGVTARTIRKQEVFKFAVRDDPGGLCLC
ncbi:HET-E1 [Symbiodinium sp. CCMP2456]|nr:HET-E1 [Symbiodinium sp. CCMP2456]